MSSKKKLLQAQEKRRIEREKREQELYGENASTFRKENEAQDKKFVSERDAIYKKYGYKKLSANGAYTRVGNKKINRQAMQDELAAWGNRKADANFQLNQKYRISNPVQTKGPESINNSPDYLQSRLGDKYSQFQEELARTRPTLGTQDIGPDGLSSTERSHRNNLLKKYGLSQEEIRQIPQVGRFGGISSGLSGESGKLKPSLPSLSNLSMLAEQRREENDIKEMLGDRYAEYRAQMDALGPIKRTTSSSTIGGGKGFVPGEKGWQEQQAQIRALRQQFGIDSSDPAASLKGEKSPLQQFRESRDNKRVDDMIAQYGSFDNYQKQMREQSRKSQIERMIKKGDIEGAMAAENQFKEEDAKIESQRTQLEDFRKRYGIEAPPPVDERKRFMETFAPKPLPSGPVIKPYRPDPTRPVGRPSNRTDPRQKPTEPPKPGHRWEFRNASRQPNSGRWVQVGPDGREAPTLGSNPFFRRPANNLGGGLMSQLTGSVATPTQQSQQSTQQAAQRTQPAAQQQAQQASQQQAQQQAQPQSTQAFQIGPQQQQAQMKAQMYQTQQPQQQPAQQQPQQQQESEEEKKRKQAQMMGN